MAQKCFYHPREDATTHCESCKLSICDQCDLESLCRDCRNKRRAIADRQRRAAQARHAGEEPPALEASSAVSEDPDQPRRHDPERVAYRRPEQPQPVVHKRPRLALVGRLSAVDPRLWGVAAALALLGVGAWLGWWSGEAVAPPPELATAAAAGTPAPTVTPAPAVRGPAVATRAVWDEAERLARQQVAETKRVPAPGSSLVAAPAGGGSRAPGLPQQGVTLPDAASPQRPEVPLAKVAPRRSAALSRAGAAGGARPPAGSRPQAAPPLQVQPAGRPQAAVRAQPRLQARARRLAWHKARRLAWHKARRLRPGLPRPSHVEPPGAPLVTRWED